MLQMIKIALLVLLLEFAGVGVLTLILRFLYKIKRS